jgi:hypothetical protein
MLCFQKGFDPVMEMMGIDHDGAAPGLNQAVDDAIQQGLSVDGKQGLGNMPCMRQQAGPQPRT